MIPSEEWSGSDRNALADYQAAVARTDALIDRSPPPKTPAAVRRRAELRLARLQSLLDALGNPHLGYPIIHIAGTSGKGSTAVMAASVLTHAGYRTGLHTSPYLQSATEKVQIDGRLLAATTFRELVEEVLAVALRAGIEHVTYGEIWFALVALALKRLEVDVAVIEVGAGGRFDLTNVVTPAVSVITSIGLDHTDTLGASIPEIAWHKAGIIKPGIAVISAVTNPTALPVIEREAESAGSSLLQIAHGATFNFERMEDGRFRWWESSRPDCRYLPAMPGRFQAVNAATALAAIRAIPDLGETILGSVVQTGLTTARLPGRFEVVQREPEVVLDGAHNPQKMTALAADLREWRQNHPGAHIIVVFGVLEAKDHGPMVTELTVVADEIVTTSPRVLAKPGTSAEALADATLAIGFAGPITALADPTDALDLALRVANPPDLVLVTGSLYLVGNVRGRWYPDDEIVVQRTPWPVRGNDVDSTSTAPV